MIVLTPEQQFRRANRAHEEAKAALRRKRLPWWRRIFLMLGLVSVLAVGAGACRPPNNPNWHYPGCSTNWCDVWTECNIVHQFDPHIYPPCGPRP